MDCDGKVWLTFYLPLNNNLIYFVFGHLCLKSTSGSPSLFLATSFLVQVFPMKTLEIGRRESISE